MTVFETVKAAVTPVMTAERYGLRVSRSGMARCPFHDDHTPSMKLNEDYYYCFGCGSHGDVIDLTAKLFDLPALDAAKKLAADFGIPGSRPSILAKLKQGKRLVDHEKLCFRVLTDYLHILQDWKTRYAPQTPEDEPHPHFVEACHMLACIEYLLDLLNVGSGWERADLVAGMMQGDKIALLQERVQRIKEEAHGQA